MANNRELSQFASFVSVNDATNNISIATTALPNIGIGTTNPSAKFEVVGNTKLQTLIVTGITTLTGVTTTGSDLYVGGDLYVADDLVFDEFTARNGNITGITTFVNGPVFIGSGTSTGTAGQRLQVTGGAYVSGSVGIGTTNPTSKLSVEGDGNFTGVVTASSFSGNASSATYADNAGIATFATNAGVSTSVIGGIGSITQLSVSGITTTGTLNVGTGGTIIITTDAGLVGIGTTNPTSKLSVEGDGNFTGVVTATAFYGNGSNLTSLAGMGTAVSTSGFGADVFFTNSIGYVTETTTLSSPDPSSSPILYTRYEDIVVSDGVDLIIGNGNELFTDVLQLSQLSVI